MNRAFINQSLSFALVFLCIPCCLANSIHEKLTLLESKEHIRLGVSAINTANNQIINYRANERFPIQSTFKMLSVAAVLHQSMSNPSLLKQKINFKNRQLASWSPITEKNLERNMTISDLCAAAMMYSDNTATNLLIEKLGGLKRVTGFARLLKNDSLRLDHLEPHMNSDPTKAEDSSTPEAMQKSLKTLALGNILSKSMREQFNDWLKKNTTGDTRIRAGIPKGWMVGDKTGAGDDFGVSNDIAVIWPPNHAPIVLAIYTAHSDKNSTRRDDVVAEVTRLIIGEFKS